MSNIPKRRTTTQRASASSAQPVTATSVDTLTFAGFACQVVAASPPKGVLDAASQGVWGVAEQAGLLAGAWRRHRNLMHEMDVPAVTAILGELLVAVAQTAHALGVPLEVVAQQQLARLPATTSRVRAPSCGGRRPQPLEVVSHDVPVAPMLPAARAAPDPQPSAGQAPGAARQAPPLETPHRAPSGAPSGAPAAAPPDTAERTVGKRGSVVGTRRRPSRPSADIQELASPPAPGRARRSRRTASEAPAPVPMGAQFAVPLAPTAPTTLGERRAPVSTGTKGKRSTPVPPASAGARTAPRVRSAQTQGTQAPPTSGGPVLLAAEERLRTPGHHRAHADDEATS